MGKNKVTEGEKLSESGLINRCNPSQDTAVLIDMAAEQYANLLLETYQARREKQEFQSNRKN